MVTNQNNGVRPEIDAVAAWCKTGPGSRVGRSSSAYGDENDEDSTNFQGPTSVKGEVKVLWTDYRDRGVDQDTLVWIECDATPLFRAHHGLSDALPATFDAQQVAAMSSVTMDFAFEHKLGTGADLETSTSGPIRDPLILWYTAADVRTDIHQPEVKVRQAACLSPAFYEEGEMPLLRWLEWREHMRRIGTERVNWYGRERGMGKFVDAYNRLAGTKDIFRWGQFECTLVLMLRAYVLKGLLR